MILTDQPHKIVPYLLGERHDSCTCAVVVELTGNARMAQLLALST